MSESGILPLLRHATEEFEANFAAMNPGPENPLPQTDRTSWWSRAAASLCFAALFGLALALVRQQNPVYPVLYSVCIGLICWLCIDVGRLLVARALSARGDRERDRTWPGWIWMIALIVVGSACGYTGGTSIGDWLTGTRPSNLFGAESLRESLTFLLLSLASSGIATYYFYSRGALADRTAAAEAAQRQAAESRV